MGIESEAFETVHGLLAAESSTALNRVFNDFVTPRGADFWTAVMLCRGSKIDPSLPSEFGAPPVLWQKHYRENSYALDDPATLRVMRSHDAFFLSDIEYERNLAARARTIVGERTDWGLGHGLVAPVRLCDGTVWALCCWGAVMERVPNFPIALGLVGQVFTARAAALASASRAPPGTME